MTPAEEDKLRALLREARTIAVVGLSPNPMRPSNSVARYLQRSGYTIVPVNPGHPEILGAKSYRTLTDAAREACLRATSAAMSTPDTSGRPRATPGPTSGSEAKAG